MQVFMLILGFSHIINPRTGPKPYWKISNKAIKVHGITNEIAKRDGIVMIDVIREFEERIKILNGNSGYLVAHNIVIIVSSNTL
jgi:DNA polymerase III epsilon subunit-like protein